MIDFDKAHNLLQVFEKAMGHPKLKPLADAAMAELESMLKPGLAAQAKAYAPEPELDLKPKTERRV